jgi:glucosamine--fructose-6-phosphate aminotransferase (isomerizing)
VSDSLLREEIFSQPEALRRLFQTQAATVEAIAQDLRGQFDYVLIAARGTSDNAARYAQYLLGIHNQIQVALATPSVFTLYGQAPSLKGALVVGISQSGQSPDVGAVLAEATRQGQPTLAITNDSQSPLAQAVDHVITLGVGPEKAIAATKTYTSSIGAVAMLSAALSNDSQQLQTLERVPGLMSDVMQNEDLIRGRVERYRYADRCAVVGRGYNYATAFEIALKVKELTGIVAEPYSSADFRHGPIRMVTGGFPLLLIAPSGQVLEDVRTLLEEIRQLEGDLIVISDQGDLLQSAELGLGLPQDVPEWISPLLTVIPGQLLALYLAKARGLDPDNPRGLNKVTQTW